MNSEEIGLLVMKLQDDDVLASDMRKFISALMSDEEIRANARLVAGLSGLPEDVRQKHCLANVLMLLSVTQLGPNAGPNDQWIKAKPTFVQKYFLMVGGPWAKHMRTVETMVPMEFQRRVRASLKTRGAGAVPEMQVSSLLFSHIRVLEEFWGVVGLLV